MKELTNYESWQMQRYGNVTPGTKEPEEREDEEINLPAPGELEILTDDTE
jgi:hypothetical protein